MNLSSNEITSLNFLANNTSLTDLTLSYNTRIKDFDALTSLIGLTDLNLSGTSITNLTALGSLTNLESLSLKGCRIGNWAALPDFKKIESLSVSFIKKEDVALFKAMPSLRFLHITNTEENVIALMEKELPNVDVN